jgi:hypothetical protein
MKKFLAFLLVICGVFFAGCYTDRTSNVEITCEELIAAYEEAGYGVFHNETDEGEDVEYNCYVRINDPNSDDYAYFHFFDSHEEALAYFEEAPYATIGVGLFSLIWGQPTWLRNKTYNQITIEYDNAELYKPFQKLLREKSRG